MLSICKNIPFTKHMISRVPLNVLQTINDNYINTKQIVYTYNKNYTPMIFINRFHKNKLMFININEHEELSTIVQNSSCYSYYRDISIPNKTNRNKIDLEPESGFKINVSYEMQSQMLLLRSWFNYNPQDKYLQMKREGLAFIKTNENAIYMTVASYMNLQTAKAMIVNQLAKVKTFGTFLQTEDGYKVTAPEGFVAIRDGSALKLVDRLEFSKANFTIAKNWDKG
jgi:hypothetical protein